LFSVTADLWNKNFVQRVSFVTKNKISQLERFQNTGSSGFLFPFSATWLFGAGSSLLLQYCW